MEWNGDLHNAGRGGRGEMERGEKKRKEEEKRRRDGEREGIGRQIFR